MTEVLFPFWSHLSVFTFPQLGLSNVHLLVCDWGQVSQSHISFPQQKDQSLSHLCNLGVYSELVESHGKPSLSLSVSHWVNLLHSIRTRRGQEDTAHVWHDYNPPSLPSALTWELKYSVLEKGLTCPGKGTFRVFSAGLTRPFRVLFLKRLSKKKQANAVWRTTMKEHVPFTHLLSIARVVQTHSASYCHGKPVLPFQKLLLKGRWRNTV